MHTEIEQPIRNEFRNSDYYFMVLNAYFLNRLLYNSAIPRFDNVLKKKTVVKQNLASLDSMVGFSQTSLRLGSPLPSTVYTRADYVRYDLQSIKS